MDFTHPRIANTVDVEDRRLQSPALRRGSRGEGTRLRIGRSLERDARRGEEDAGAARTHDRTSVDVCTSPRPQLGQADRDVDADDDSFREALEQNGKSPLQAGIDKPALPQRDPAPVAPCRVNP